MTPERRSPSLLQSVASALGRPISTTDAAIVLAAFGTAISVGLLSAMAVMIAANAHNACALGF